MSKRLQVVNRASRLRAGLQRLAENRSGAGAIEFAFMIPIILGIYLSSFEITNAYSAAAKILKAANTVSDIVARQTSVNKSMLAEMIDAAEATIAPSSADGMTLKITGVSIDSAGNTSALWSWDQDGRAPYAKGSSVSVPSDIRTPSSFLIHAEVSVPHTVLLYLSSAAGLNKQSSSITLRREFYYRQRLGHEIPCGDCS